MTAPVLKIEHLRIAACTEAGDERLIVDGVDVELGRGEVLGVIGESGSGKTTLGLAVLGYTRPGCAVVRGRVLFRGHALNELTPAGRRALRGRHLAYIAQSAAASFNPARNLMTQVCEAPVRHGLLRYPDARRRAIDLFAELDLPSPASFGERYPHQVSGGQLQRAMAAMAMSCHPDVLVLDEPTTALDVTTQIEVLAALRKLIRDHQAAAVYISHDLAVVAQVAHRILVLRDGRCVEFGEAGQILQAPREEYTRRLVSTRTAAVRSGMTEATAPLLEVDRVSARYGRGPRVLEEVSVQVRRGETVAVVGESGSGKSSLARVVCGLLPHESGALRFGGDALPARLAQRGRESLRRIQMIYQSPDVALNPRQTVREIVGRPLAFYFGHRRVAVEPRVETLLGLVDLPPDFAARRPSELSGGQQQRVAIARALAAEPDLVICDEVTSALDPLVAEDILRLLDRLQRETGIAYVFISHDLGIVRRVADRVAIMRRGRVLVEGPLAQVFTPPCHPYTELLLSSVPEMRADWLDGVLRERRRQGHGAMEVA